VTLKDMNRGTVYDGPLIIMVNGQSASASEVLAAAIQDYNRGLIVGSRTYGKATGQNLFPIEGAPRSLSPQKSNAGYVKLTTQKLYRVTGKSNQGGGVVPDILLPDVFSALGERESEQAFALQRDSVLMNPYFKPELPIKRKELQALSGERVSGNPAFTALEKAVFWLEEAVAIGSKPHPLVWEKYVAMTNEDELSDIPQKLRSEEKIFEVVDGASKEQRLAVDGYARELYSRWHENLVSDPYLQETYNILRDFVSLTKNPK
jgi:carboxyl-terminal processing protease